MAKYRNITQPDDSGYQVRIVRRGKEYSKYFSHRLWGNERRSLQAAIHWRDQMDAVLLGRNKRFLKVPSNKTSTGVTGVSRTIKHDQRKNADYLCYQVFWVNDGVAKNKTFQVGRAENVSPDDELHAFRTAVHFRTQYEYAIDNNLKFDDRDYAGWKKRKVYDE